MNQNKNKLYKRGPRKSEDYVPPEKAKDARKKSITPSKTIYSGIAGMENKGSVSKPFNDPLGNPIECSASHEGDRITRNRDGGVSSKLGNKGASRVASAKKDRRIVELETELTELRNHLQSVQESYAAANEELQASNEEVVAALEELQSTNEELEFANEEIVTINEEVTIRNQELKDLNSDLINLQTSTQLSILLVGRDLSLRRFSAQAEKQFTLRTTDVGRPLGDIQHNLELPNLEKLIAEVISTVKERESEVKDKEGLWHSLRVRPYITIDHKVDGAVLVLVNIDAQKKSQNEIAHARKELQHAQLAEAILASTRDPLLILNEDLSVHAANKAFYMAFKTLPEEIVGLPIYEISHCRWDTPELRKLLKDIIPGNSHFNDFEVTSEVEDLGRRTFLLWGRPLKEDGWEAGRRLLLGIQDISETLQFQAEFRQSETSKGAILNSALDAIITINHEGNLMEFNPAAERIFGYSRESVLGKSMAECIIPVRLRQRHEQGLANYLATGKATILNRQLELPAMRSDGTEFPAELAIVMVPGSQPPLFTGFLRDITDRKITEESLLESARLAALRADISVALVSGEPLTAVFQRCTQALVKHVNVAFSRIWTLNKAADVLELQASSGIYTHLDGPHGRIKMGEFKIGRIARTQEPLLTNDVLHDPNISDPEWAKREGMVAFAGYPILLEGSVLGVVALFAHHALSKAVFNELAYISDIIAQWIKRKSAEDEARISAERFRFMAESMPQKIFTTTNTGKLVYYNQQWMEYTGLSFEQLKDRGWVQFIHPDDLEENVRRWGHCINTGEAFQMEHRFRRHDGVYRWHLSRAHAMRDREGAILIWIGSNTEIEELRQTQDELESANRSKDRFLAVLSHELRTPLTPVVMSISALQKQINLPVTVKKSLKLIERNILLEANLIDDLLDLTRIAQNKMDFIKEEVDVNECIRSAIDVCAQDLKNSPCQLKLELSPTPLMVIADRKRLQQVFWNLLKNGIKFSPGGGQLLIGAKKIEQHVTIFFGDSGIGIEKEDLCKVFDPFEQGGKTNFGGLGLGLAICKSVMEGQGGTIEVQSEGKNCGSVFRLTLPLAQTA